MNYEAENAYQLREEYLAAMREATADAAFVIWWSMVRLDSSNGRPDYVPDDEGCYWREPAQPFL